MKLRRGIVFGLTAVVALSYSMRRCKNRKYDGREREDRKHEDRKCRKCRKRRQRDIGRQEQFFRCHDH